MTKSRNPMTPDALLSLADAARLIPGATADTLKRKARAGMLTVYRPGKAYCTTAADVEAFIKSCRVEQKAPACGYVPRAKAASRHGSSLTAVASAALDSALAQVPQKKKKR